MDEHNVFDLSELLGGNMLPVSADQTELIDLSGRPAPKDVRVRLNSGIIVKCDVRYAGINPSNKARLFHVIAEIDWENYFPKTLIIGECPPDTELRFRVPGVPDNVAQEFAQGLTVQVEKWVTS